MEKIRNAFNAFVQIPDEEWVAFIPIVSQQNIRAGATFIAAGESADTIGFVTQGLFKVVYHNPSGQKFIRNFCAEGDFISCYTEAINGTSADADIQAIENSTILSVSYKNFSKFYERNRAWSELGRKLAEQYFSFRESRERQLLTQSALERYRKYLIEFKHLSERITQSDVAAYIGVTPESLSRVLKDPGGKQ